MKKQTSISWSLCGVVNKRIHAMPCFASLESIRNGAPESPVKILVLDRHSIEYGTSALINEYHADLMEELEKCDILDKVSIDSTNLKEFFLEKDPANPFFNSTVFLKPYNRGIILTYPLETTAWQVVYAFSELFRTPQESPWIPILYGEVKRGWPTLNFYQRFCIACSSSMPLVGGPLYGWSHGFVGSTSLRTIKNLSLKKVIDNFKSLGWFKEENSMAKVGIKSYFGGTQITESLLPDSFVGKADSARPYYEYERPIPSSLCNDLVQYYLNAK